MVVAVVGRPPLGGGSRSGEERHTARWRTDRGADRKVAQEACAARQQGGALTSAAATLQGDVRVDSLEAGLPTAHFRWPDLRFCKGGGGDFFTHLCGGLVRLLANDRTPTGRR
jgi:hypothetical protein